MKERELVKAINKQWEENEKHIGEQAALYIACEQYGKSVDWFYDKLFKLNKDNK